MLAWPGSLAGGAVIVASAGLLLVTSLSGTPCTDNGAQLVNRVNELEQTYSGVATADTRTIDGCQTIDCARPEKLEIAGALRNFDDGLEKICWPGKDEQSVKALIAANGSLADAYMQWADANGPIDDQSLATVVGAAAAAQSEAVTALSSSLRR